MSNEKQYPVIIIGSGVSGLSAAIYAARAGNSPLVIQGDEPGGQLTLTTGVENYPGFPDGINGSQLISNMEKQAEKFGAEVIHGIVETISEDSPKTVSLSNGDTYTADAIIVASGASARTLGVPGEDELMGYGVSTCATCDGAFFRGEDMLVVGGGDAAMEEASFLTKFADTVYIAHRRDSLRAEEYWISQIEDHIDEGEVEILWDTELTEIKGSKEDGIEGVTLVENPDGYPKEKIDDPTTTEYTLDVGAVFLAIGHTPNTEFLQDTGVELDEQGYVQVKGGRGGGQTKTDVEGIFAAGDVVDYHYQQAVTAAGLGSKAAIDADTYLSEA